jgi:copper transport protein
VKRAVILMLLVALAAPAGAAAHARLVRTVPADGAVLDKPPSRVRVEFDDGVRTAPGSAAVANATGASILGGKTRARGRVLIVPLRHGLAPGAYSVRWSVASDDGHREQGVLAFTVGHGGAAAHSVLGASSELGWNDVVLRALYYLGLLAGGGAAVFGLSVRRIAGVELRRPLAHLLFFSLLTAFVGASGIVHAAPTGTRYALVLKIALTISLVGGAAAALAPTYPALLALAGLCALALVAAPTLSGHALDPDQPRVLAAAIDLAHTASAAVWFGGLLALAFVVPRGAGPGERRALARRFSSTALVAVIALALTGLGRALTELSAVGQIWSTSYGRALIVKTALFVPLLGLGWLNRSLLAGAFARLRRSVLVEVIVLTAVVVVVGILTQLRPGKLVSLPGAAAAPPVARGRPPALPRAGAVVDARELGTLALAVARFHGAATVTLIDRDGNGVTGRRVTIDDARARACGSGCYQASAAPGRLRVGVGGRTILFDVPVDAPSGTALLAHVTRAYRGARTIVFDERLASNPGNAEVTRFEVVAPDRLSYRTRGGPAGVVIGARRWDRQTPGGRWLPSQQTRLDVTQPYWRASRNVHLVSPNVLTFVDPTIPAWFRLSVTSGRLGRLRMTSAAHFMVDRYAGFDGPVSVSPPPPPR